MRECLSEEEREWGGGHWDAGGSVEELVWIASAPGELVVARRSVRIVWTRSGQCGLLLERARRRCSRARWPWISSQRVGRKKALLLVYSGTMITMTG